MTPALLSKAAFYSYIITNKTKSMFTTDVDSHTHMQRWTQNSDYFSIFQCCYTATNYTKNNQPHLLSQEHLKIHASRSTD